MSNLTLRAALLIATAVNLSACVSGTDGRSLNDKVAAQDATISQLQANAKTDKATIANKESKISELEAQKTDLEGQVADFEAKLTKAEADKADLKAKLDSANADKADLKVKLDSANASINELQGKLDAANATIDGLNAQIAQLSADLKDAQGQLVAANKAYGAYLNTAYNARQDKTEYKRIMGLDQSAVDAATQAKAAADQALAAAPVPPAGAIGNTLATFVANDRKAAEAYAAFMGLDVSSATDLSALVGDTAYQDKIANLQAAATDTGIAADQAKTAFKANYGGSKQGDVLTLYRADGEEVGAAGVAIYRNKADATKTGEAVPVVARLTALYLMDENGYPTDILLLEGAGAEAFNAPVGAASFTSDSMIAFFAQKEGNGSYAIQYDQSGSAGQLTLNFNTNDGTLTVNGLQNGNNYDYSIAADLAFDPVTGKFTGSGDQAYTSNASGSAETAVAAINGELWGAAEAFTATIDAVDKTTLDDIPVHIMTGLGGTGTTN